MATAWTSPTTATGTINVSRLLDDRPTTRYQLAIIALCALVALLDGFDTQNIGFAAPALTAVLKLQPGMVGTVFSAGLLGAMLGAAGFGAVADRFGRKRPVIVAALLFAVFSLATIFITSFQELLACRFLAGLGLGGATPSFIALTSEYVPSRRRSVAVAVLWSAFPIGGMIGGFSSSWLIPHVGWQSVFVIGGLLPLIIAVALALWLPDSLRFLIASRNDQPAAARIMRRLAPELPVGVYVVDEERISGAPIAALFRDGRAAATILLWVPFFVVFMMLAVIVLWTPSLLREMGLTAATGALLIGANNLGAAIGNATCGWLMDRFNPFPILATSYVVGGALLIPIAWLSDNPAAMAACLVLNGLFLGAGSAGTIVMAARIYPTLMRSTGVGWGMAMGRFGQVVGPLIAGAMVTGGLTIKPIFVALAVSSIIASVSILALKSKLAAGFRQAAGESLA